MLFEHITDYAFENVVDHFLLFGLGVVFDVYVEGLLELLLQIKHLFVLYILVHELIVRIIEFLRILLLVNLHKDRLALLSPLLNAFLGLMIRDF